MLIIIIKCATVTGAGHLAFPVFPIKAQTFFLLYMFFFIYYIFQSGDAEIKQACNAPSALWE